MQSRFSSKKPDNSLSQLSQGGGFSSKPRALRCSICGREFGTASLEIHQKSCIKKYQNDLTNMEPAHRVQMPSTKQVMEKLQQEKAYREQAPKGRGGMTFVAEQPAQIVALVQCRRCGRRFNPDRIRKHESVCIGPEPDVGAIKQQIFEQNKRAARKLRPKQTGKWRRDHHEFQQALKEMRKIRMQELQEQRGGASYSYYGKRSEPSRMQERSGMNRQQQQKPPQYTQSVKGAHKQPSYEQNKSSKAPIANQKGPQQRSANPRSSSYGNKYQDSPSYGRPTQAMGGQQSYQIAKSNVSTFSLFTTDGKPNNYDQYQRNNPYARKNGLY